MNAPIGRLFMFFVLLFAFLIVWTSRWTVFDSKALNNNALNKRTLAQDLKIREGRILAADGTVLAKSVPAGDGTWRRVYPTGSLFSQPVGYFNVLANRKAGLEESRLSELKGLTGGLTSVFGQTAQQQVGDDVYTTLDVKGQEEARAALDGRAGAVVALNPKTGAVLVMYANPSPDPAELLNHPDAPGQFDNALQAQDPPGSTFKIVTATAAIDTGQYTPTSMIDGHSPIIVSGVPLSNDQGDPQFGLVSLSDAFAQSINTVFAKLAGSLGVKTMTKYMKRFGFYSLPPLDYPPSQMTIGRPDSLQTNKPLPAGDENEDIGRIGIGQGGLEVTPLQMAEVVATVANGGKLMTPHLTSKAVNQDGVTVETIKPSVFSTVMKPSTAADLSVMMKDVVEEGTGVPADFGSLSVAGKTGTAQIGNNGEQLTEPWFVGFSPVSNPQIAIAVTVQQTVNGYGATTAAPIARDVIQTLLSEGK